MTCLDTEGTANDGLIHWIVPFDSHAYLIAVLPKLICMDCDIETQSVPFGDVRSSGWRLAPASMVDSVQTEA